MRLIASPTPRPRAVTPITPAPAVRARADRAPPPVPLARVEARADAAVTHRALTPVRAPPPRSDSDTRRRAAHAYAAADRLAQPKPRHRDVRV